MLIASHRLQKTRRKRPVPAGWANDEQISTYKPEKASEQLYPGGRLLAIAASGERAIVGSPHGVAGIYDCAENVVVSILKGGAGAITGGVWIDDDSRAVISTATGQVKVFDGKEESASFATHAGAVTAVALHPSGSILASVGVDKSYAIYDLEGVKVVAQVYTDAGMFSSEIP